MTRKERYKGITEWFEANMPDPRSELHYGSPFELLVAVILSAQCTDKRVNMIAPKLFERWPTPEALAAVAVEEVREVIASISYPNAKAENLVRMARRLCEVYQGQVPGTVKELETLAGVGRKTANVVVSIVFDTPAMAVDTHVFRVSKRIGLTTAKTTTPLDAEVQLTAHFDRAVLARAHHWLILHGRYVCTARTPKCHECGIRAWCATDARNSIAATKKSASRTLHTKQDKAPEALSESNKKPTKSDSMEGVKSHSRPQKLEAK